MVCEGDVCVHSYLLFFIFYQLYDLWVDLLVRHFRTNIHGDLEELKAHVTPEFPTQILAHLSNEALELL